MTNVPAIRRYPNGVPNYANFETDNEYYMAVQEYLLYIDNWFAPDTEPFAEALNALGAEAEEASNITVEAKDEAVAAANAAKAAKNAAEAAVSILPMGSISLISSDTQAYPSSKVDKLISAGGSISFIASGYIADGVSVALNPDGTVSQIKKTPGLLKGDNFVIHATTNANNGQLDSAMIDSSHVLICTKHDAESYITLYVCEIIGSNLVVISTRSTTYTSSALRMCKVSNGLFVVSYISSYMYSFSISISSDFAISVSSTSAMTNYSAIQSIDMVAIDTGKAVAVISAESSSSYQKAYVLSVSTNGVVINTGYELGSTQTNSVYPVLVALDTNKFFVSWYIGNSYIVSKVGVVSGTTISFGASVQISDLSSGSYASKSIVKIDNSRVLMKYTDNLGTNMMSLVVMNISGSTITMSPVQRVPGAFFMSFQNLHIAEVSENKFIVLGGSNMDAIYLTVGADNIVTVGTKFTIVSESWGGRATVRNTLADGKSIIVYSTVNSTGIKAFLLQDYTTNAANFVGFSDNQAYNEDEVNIKALGSYTEKQDSLHINSYYTIDDSGNVVESSSGIGKAISATKLLITAGGL